MPEERYHFTEETFDRLAEVEVSPISVLQVLHGGRVARRHIGSVLHIAGQDRAGTWLVVALIEQGDDEYLVLSARYLDQEEIQAIARMRGESHG